MVPGMSTICGASLNPGREWLVIPITFIPPLFSEHFLSGQAGLMMLVPTEFLEGPKDMMEQKKLKANFKMTKY